MKTKKLVKNYCRNVLNHYNLTMLNIDDYIETVYNEIDINDTIVKDVNRIIIKCYFKELKRQIKDMYEM
jgi:hypothetical protein